MATNIGLELDLNQFLPIPEGDEEENVDTSNDTQDNGEKDNKNKNLDTFGQGIKDLPEDFKFDEEVEDDIEDSDNTEDEEVEEPTIKSNSSIYAAFAKELVDTELIDEDVIGNIKDLDSLLEAVQTKYTTELSKAKEEFLNTTSKEYRAFLKEKAASGEIDTTSTVSEFLKYKEEDFEDNDELATNIMKYFYTEVKGLEPEVVKNIVENEIDIISKSKKIYRELKKEDEKVQVKIKEEFKKKEETQRNQVVEFEKNLFTNAKKLHEFIPGYKVNDKVAKELTDSIPEILKEINTNLVEYAPKLALLKKAGFFDGKFDTLINKGVTKQAKEFDKLLHEKSFTSGKGSVPYKKDPSIRWDK